VTVILFADSSVNSYERSSGAAAELTAIWKIEKYTALMPSYMFQQATIGPLH